MPRQSQNQSTAPSRKKALLSVAILLALTGVLVLLFQDHWAEISAALAQLSLGQVALVLALRAGAWPRRGADDPAIRLP